MIRHAARTLLILGVALGASRLLYGCALPLRGLGADPQDRDASIVAPVVDDLVDARAADVAIDSEVQVVDALDATPDATEVVESGADLDAWTGVTPDAEAGRDASVPDAGPEGEAGVIAPPTFVQSGFAVPQSPQALVTVLYDSPQTAGDLNVVIVGWNDSTALVTSVSDAAGNAYALAIGPTVTPGLLSQSIYYARNIASAGNNGVTVEFTVPAAFADVRVLEYAGIESLDPFSVAAGTTGRGTMADAGLVVTTTPDLIVAATMVVTATTGAGSRYAPRVLTSPNGDLVEDRFALAPGTYAATAPVSPSGPWVMQLAAFRVK